MPRQQPQTNVTLEQIEVMRQASARQMVADAMGALARIDGRFRGAYGAFASAAGPTAELEAVAECLAVVIRARLYGV